MTDAGENNRSAGAATAAPDDSPPLTTPMLTETTTSTTTLKLYRRLFKGRKQLWAPDDTAPARFFVMNRIPHKNNSSWRPVFYRGDNPKHSPDTRAIGRARRAWMWGSFWLWLGDGVHEVRENERRRHAKWKAAFKAKWRKRLGMKPKPPPAEPLEDEKEVVGKVILVKLWRAGPVHRRVTWRLEGQEYQWVGTRQFTTSKMKPVKGWSHCLKLVRKSDQAIIATFEKNRWSSFRKSIKTGGPPNKTKSYIGTLTIFPEAYTVITSAEGDNEMVSETVELSPVKVAEETASKRKKKEVKNLHPNGTHSGNLLEEAIVTTCWIVAEAEHRLRYKILEFLQQVAETVGG